MDFMYTFASNIKYFYNTINPASLTGAIDVIVVEQPDGSLLSTPFHVRFGKYGVFNCNQQYIKIMINNEEIKLKMKLGENGVGYFVQETDATEVPEYLASSPIPGSPVPASPAVSDIGIDDTSRKLKKQQQREESRARFEKKRFPNRRSRSRTPLSPIRSQPKPVAANATPPEPSLDQKAKMKMPFTSSIFSNRRYRSLPDLSSIGTSVDSQTPPAATTEFSNVVQQAIAELPSSSSKSSDKVDLQQELGSGNSGMKKSQLSTPVKSVTFAPSSPSSISVASDFDDSAIEAGDVEKKHDMSTSSSYDTYADGALSDSEVDKIRKAPEVHNDTVWKWGEFPKSSKPEKKKEAAEASESVWSWFSWRSTPPQPKGDEVYLDDLLNKEASPGQMEKYFGRRVSKKSSSSTASTEDSGNGHSAPASPSAASMDLLNVDQDETPTSSQAEMKTAVEKKTAIELEMLAGTDQFDDSPNTKFGQEVKERQKSGNSISEASVISEEEAPPVVRTSYIRSLRLSSEELKSLQLQYGPNEARFSVTTNFQGTSWCSCHIYLFKYSDKLVISDIDGTITKSDVLGHIIPAIGGQWAHAGVAELYTRIKHNGYKMVYLSSRAIGQSHYTKAYLRTLAQGSKTLPDGPVLLSPMSVFMALKKEIIERKPEEFKIACLLDLKSLFPMKHPFYAGFGNRETDVRSYAAVEIPAERILIINPSGIVKRADAGAFSSSYSTMAMEMVDYLFPPLQLVLRQPLSCQNTRAQERWQKLRANFTKPQTCSTFTHWRNAPEETAISEDELAAYERKRKEMAEKNKKAAKKKSRKWK